MRMSEVKAEMLTRLSESAIMFLFAIFDHWTKVRPLSLYPSFLWQDWSVSSYHKFSSLLPLGALDAPSSAIASQGPPDYSVAVSIRAGSQMVTRRPFCRDRDAYSICDELGRTPYYCVASILERICHLSESG